MIAHEVRILPPGPSRQGAATFFKMEIGRCENQRRLQKKNA